MKRFIYFIFLSVLFLTYSCKKEDIKPNNAPTQETVSEELSLFGKWLLVDGALYLENIETHEKIKYDHFGPGKTTSSLDLDGADIEFEVIEQNVTTWSFYAPNGQSSYGKFVLNSDTLNPYGFYITNHNWTIIEDPQATISTMQLGGSSRPISAAMCSMVDSTAYFYVQQGYTSIDNMNYKYISELKFKKIEEW